MVKIYTRTGDNGTSGLIGGTRVKKSDIRLESYGTIDELNSWMGLIKCSIKDSTQGETIFSIQNALFIIASNLATDESKSDLRKKIYIKEEDITLIEKEIDRMQDILPVLNNFIIPGGVICSNYIHIARTVCRRAERRISELYDSISNDDRILTYINRLSDYLFVLSRYVNFIEGEKETYWKV